MPKDTIAATTVTIVITAEGSFSLVVHRGLAIAPGLFLLLQKISEQSSRGDIYEGADAVRIY
jgi:hypothetical protein